MKLRTRLIVAFFIIILVPFLVFGIIMIGLSRYQAALESYYGVSVSLDNLSDSMQLVGSSTEEIFKIIQKQAEEEPDQLLNRSYLDSLNEQLQKRSAFLLVRKDEELYYNGSGEDVSELFAELPVFREFSSASDGGSYIGQNVKAFVKQQDVEFSDGTKASIFIISSASDLVSQAKRVFRDIAFAVVVILVLTAFLMVVWIYTGVNIPLKKLSEATHRIKEKDFDFELDVKGKDEISDLCREFDDMRRQLKVQDEEKAAFDRQSKELISNISHDLKTPVTAVKGYVEGIMDGVADTPEKMDRYIRTIYIKANEMDRLINELTFYSKIDTNRIPYNFNKIDVVEYFDDCADDVGLDLHEQKIQFSYINTVEIGTLIIADAEQMTRVINNIISNSVKYMDKPKKEIQLRAFEAGDSIQVEIEDNGKGIPNKDLPSIFERFFRTDLSRNSAQGGSGIGLSIVKKIIEDHGGRIWATSKLGEGTTMHFVLRKYQISGFSGEQKQQEGHFK